ncbi:zinc metalloprotease mde10 [Sodiomyces alkalinus F11]|uniref:Disintegrin and metalloproteinase domain-containing protein B n=1 Tax=Sodiomyces alkalinus (strain CBS 110278 / VKM F-3762 / F11) TaxID=1314773 RepID=A0A3N2Q918_SODAK|nr:zinc metalloprotease mde10 [Sodiomyces alkalinus F11]ROT43281.1 zinc metalloprotease mde10 [Sodiomyces alkalinus F11]
MVSLRSLFTFIGVSAIVQDVVANNSHRNPLKYISILEEPTFNTPSKRVHSHSSFDLTFSLHDGQQDVRLALEPNHDILQDNLQVNYLAPDGTLRQVEHVQRHEHKVFRGKAFVRREDRSEWTHVGWARITVHRDGKHPVLEGAFRVDGDHHHIHTASNYRRLRHPQDPDVENGLDPDEYMVVWRDSDIMDDYYYYDDSRDLKRDVRGSRHCDSEQLSFNTKYDPWAHGDEEDPLRAASTRSLFGRQMDTGPTGDDGAAVGLASTIGSTLGCPNTRRVALVGIATDCTYTAAFNSSQSVRSNMINLVNAASEVYENSFNISLGIQNLTISDAACPASASNLAPWNIGCDPNTRIGDRLVLFSRWRGAIDDNNAFWTLFSTCDTGSAVGLAWLGQVCVQGSQDTEGNDGGVETVSSANVVLRTPQSEWQVFAHEAGHTFGAVHDCDEGECAAVGSDGMRRCCPLSADECDARAQFLMNPSTGSHLRQFSPCTIGNVCSALYRNAIRSDCLMDNRNVETITGSQCGNGIVEAGEDCDCGGAEECGDDPCCNPETCRFTENSVCDPANEACCTGQCRFAASGAVCRESTGLCDPQEVCPGDSGMCPSDRHLDDGESCGDDGDNLRCASGQCTSRDQQCQVAVGSRDTNNETTACGSQCQLLCRSPTVFGTDMCRQPASQFFIDGTPCSNGGRCRNGVCRGESVAGSVENFFQEYRHIIIPVAASVGGLIALAILWCCVSSCCKRRRRNKAAKQPPSPPPAAAAAAAANNDGHGYGGAWNASVPPPAPPSVPPVPPPQPQMSSQYGSYGNDPQRDYPSNYSQGSGPSYPGQWMPQRGQGSMNTRYA